MFNSIINQEKSKALCATIIAVILVEGYTLSRFAIHHSASQIFLFSVYCLIVLIDIFFVFREFICKGRTKSLCDVFLISAFCSFVFEGLTILGSPGGNLFSAEEWNRRRLLIFFVVFFISMQFLFFRFHFSKKEILAFISNIPQNRKTILTVAVIAATSAIVVFRIGTASPLVFEACALLGMLLSIGLYCSRHISLAHVFFLTAYLAGSMIIYTMPITTGISWDDQIHYENALDVSYLVESKITNVDKSFIEEASDREQGKDAVSIISFDYNKINDHANNLDQLYLKESSEGNFTEYRSEAIFSFNFVGYIFTAIGLWLGRLFHLGFCATIVLGKMANLIGYSFIVSRAIRITPEKAIVFSFVGMLPTCIFLASSFSYDAWIISFLMLGFAYYLRYAWGKGSDCNLRNVTSCFAFTTLGLMVKAIYFPIIGLFFLIPKNRLNGVIDRRRYYALVFFLGLFICASFALPYLFTAGGDAGDSRGGLGINPSEQLAFITSNPIEYLQILINYFLEEYFNPGVSAGYALSYAYLGTLDTVIQNADLAQLVRFSPAISLVCLAITSSDASSRKHVGVLNSAWAAFLFLFTFLLIATALYVSFTPVAHKTINGCQLRYILPMLVPGLICILNMPFSKMANKLPYNVFWILLSCVFILSCYALLIFAKS